MILGRKFRKNMSSVSCDLSFERREQRKTLGCHKLMKKDETWIYDPMFELVKRIIELVRMFYEQR